MWIDLILINSPLIRLKTTSLEELIGAQNELGTLIAFVLEGQSDYFFSGNTYDTLTLSKVCGLI